MNGASRVMGLGLLALAGVAGLPATGLAGWFGVRNDTQAVVIFQGASVANNVVRRGRPHVLNPGQEAWEFITPGPKLINIYDARMPGRVLYEGNFLAGNADLFFSFQIGTVVVPPGVQVPQAQLLPARPLSRPQ
jgi:hypothetical protein